MQKLIFIGVLLLMTHLCLAQIRATTESGNTVLLFDDGTWKYEEKKIVEEKEDLVSYKTKEKVIIAIDSSHVLKTDPVEFVFQVSKRLENYFGEAAAKVRCKLSCANTEGAIRIGYNWDFPVGDGQRYFGYLKQGKNIKLYLANGETVDLFVENDSKVKAVPKFNKTSISGETQPLTMAQIALLTTQPVTTLEMDWKKRPEVYEVNDQRYFIENLPGISHTEVE